MQTEKLGFTLAEYDRQHDTELLETLHAYLLCHNNVADAASMLFIHRNTMSYRMSRINELICIDIDNSETDFHLLYSYHVLEYFSATVMRDREEIRKRKRYLK